MQISFYYRINNSQEMRILPKVNSQETRILPKVNHSLSKHFMFCFFLQEFNNIFFCKWDLCITCHGQKIQYHPKFKLLECWVSSRGNQLRLTDILDMVWKIKHIRLNRLVGKPIRPIQAFKLKIKLYIKKTIIMTQDRPIN